MLQIVKGIDTYIIVYNLSPIEILIVNGIF